MKKSIFDLLIEVRDAKYLLQEAENSLLGDVDGNDLENARSELANASNAIDDAMGEIDKLLAPEPTVWDDPHLP